MNEEVEIIEGEKESAEELTIRIAKKAKGIGSAGAGAIAIGFNGKLECDIMLK